MISELFPLKPTFILIKGKLVAVYHCEALKCKSPIPVRLYFIHGVGGSAWVWRHQVTFFMTLGYEIIALDLPGHGQSPIPHGDQLTEKQFDCCSSLCFNPRIQKIYQSFKFSELSTDVLAVFDHFVHGKNDDATINVIVAHSYGTSLALYVAHERPDKVDRLVLISGGAPVALEPFCWPYCLPLGFFTCLWACVVRQFRRNAFAVQIPTKSNKVNDARNSKDDDSTNSGTELSKGCLVLADIENSFSIEPLVLKATMRGQTWSEGDPAYHKSIRVPTLLLVGDCDQYVTVEEEGMTLQILPCATMRVIHGSGHMLMLESPERVNNHIQVLILHPPQFRLQNSGQLRDAVELINTVQPMAVSPVRN